MPYPLPHRIGAGLAGIVPDSSGPVVGVGQAQATDTLRMSAAGSGERPSKNLTSLSAKKRRKMLGPGPAA
jgi:hypothetical protein